MRIVLVDNHASTLLPEAAEYVGLLGPVLAEEHRVAILSLESGILHFPPAFGRIRRALLMDRPEILHLNNLDGRLLAASMAAVGMVAPAFQPALALTLHDDRLLKTQVGFNRLITRNIGLVVCPSAALLDQHLGQDFFPSAIQEVIPYPMPYHGEQLIDAYRRLINARRAGSLGNRAA